MDLFLIYSVFIAGVVCFQIALVFGAPWGRLTQGGQIEGALPWSRRFAAIASIVLLCAMTLALHSVDGGWPNWPSWTASAAVFISALSMFVNWITPSKPERMLWGPITTVMFILVVAIAYF